MHFSGRFKRTIIAAALALSLPFAALAQEAPPPGAAIPPPNQPPPVEESAGAPPPQAAPASYSQQQIDQLTAPVALYPDALVGQILMASTYPLEVVQADRWRQENPGISGANLQAAMDQQSWDPSVKSLVPFPQVLSMMDKNLQWTEQLGDAFLADQATVTDSIQRLRQRAQASGNLTTTPQQTVESGGGAIEIVPANPQVVYVPVYNPTVVYGAWMWPGYPPYYFPPPPGYVVIGGGVFGFAAGIAVLDWFWGWDHWDWHHHYIDIDEHRFAALDHGHAPASAVWHHDVEHRHGVPYQSPAARANYGASMSAARRNFRGYNPPVENRAAGTHAVANRPATPRAAPAAAPQSRPTQYQRPQIQQAQPQRQAPAFESFSRGEDVRAQSTRGAQSRATMQRQAAPAAHENAAPRQTGGGDRDNGRNR